MVPLEAPALSVVIPARNAEETLGEQLDALSVQRAGEPVEFIVVDNLSTDSTANVVLARAAGDRRIRLASESRAGAAAALNRGIAEARSDRLAFCDADDVVSDGWIEAAVRSLDTHDIVTGPLELDRLNDPATARSRGRSWAGRRELFAGLFPLIPSGNFAARRSVIEATGGFDPRVGTGYDVDFAYRAYRAGAEVEFDPDLVLHYRYRRDARSQWRQGRAMGRFRPSLYRRLGRDGHETPSRLGGLRRWAWLVRSLPSTRNRAGRLRWIWVAANQVGHLEGSIRARSLYL